MDHAAEHPLRNLTSLHGSDEFWVAEVLRESSGVKHARYCQNMRVRRIRETVPSEMLQTLPHQKVCLLVSADRVRYRLSEVWSLCTHTRPLTISLQDPACESRLQGRGRL